MSYALLRPFLLSLEPERAQEVTLNLLDRACRAKLIGFFSSMQSLPVECMQLTFDNPVGLAAGLDKNGDYIEAFSQMGFGFIEVGTVTPKPQEGSQKPRLFRIKEAHALINRTETDNLGVDYLVKNIKKYQKNAQYKNSQYNSKLGINIGKNIDTPIENSKDDYIYCLDKVYPYADYITLNLPNDVQSSNKLGQILLKVKMHHLSLAKKYNFYVPLAVKVSPDLTEEEVKNIAELLIALEIDGLVATNTTTSRNGVEELSNSEQKGGLSGRPINYMSTTIIRQFSDILKDKVTIIGVGGIDSGEKAVKKLEAGASLVQLYSGLIYKGPKLIENCVQSLSSHFDMKSEISHKK